MKDLLTILSVVLARADGLEVRLIIQLLDLWLHLLSQLLSTMDFR
jgi:hypothetical protein